MNLSVCACLSKLTLLFLDGVGALARRPAAEIEVAMWTMRGEERKADDGSEENPLTKSSSRELERNRWMDK